MKVVFLVSSNSLSHTCYNTNICHNTGKIVTEICPPKSKSFMVGILYRPLDKTGLDKFMDQIFSQPSLPSRELSDKLTP